MYGNATAASQLTHAGNDGPRRESSISTSMGRLSDVVGDIGGLVDVLEKRLDAVLGPEPPTHPGDSQAIAAEIKCALSHGVDGEGIRLNEARNKLSSILARIEL